MWNFIIEEREPLVTQEVRLREQLRDLVHKEKTIRSLQENLRKRNDALEAITAAGLEYREELHEQRKSDIHWTKTWEAEQPLIGTALAVASLVGGVAVGLAMPVIGAAQFVEDCESSSIAEKVVEGVVGFGAGIISMPVCVVGGVGHGIYKFGEGFVKLPGRIKYATVCD